MYGVTSVLDLLGEPLCEVYDYLTIMLYTWN